MSRCVARTKDLERCKNDTERGSVFCRRHRWWWLIALFGGVVAFTTIGANVATMFGIIFTIPGSVTATSVPTDPRMPASTLTPTLTTSPIAFTLTPAFTSTNTLVPIATWTPIPTLGISDQLVGLIDVYFSCLNSAKPNDGDDSDYEACWNLLSNRPGEYQSVINKKNFFDYWKKYRISYALFFCSKDYNNSVQYFVHARYYLYDRNDDSTPIENGTQYYVEYIFAHDDQGWRIKDANFKLDDIGSFCEDEPRINKLDISP